MKEEITDFFDEEIDEELEEELAKEFFEPSDEFESSHVVLYNLCDILYLDLMKYIESFGNEDLVTFSPSPEEAKRIINTYFEFYRDTFQTIKLFDDSLFILSRGLINRYETYTKESIELMDEELEKFFQFRSNILDFIEKSENEVRINKDKISPVSLYKLAVETIHKVEAEFYKKSF